MIRAKNQERLLPAIGGRVALSLLGGGLQFNQIAVPVGQPAIVVLYWKR